MPNASIFYVWQPLLLTVSLRKLCSFDDLSGLDTASTDFHSTIAASGKLNPDRLKIGVESSSRLVVSVRYVISKLRAFPANVAAFCHNIASPLNRGIIEFFEKLETRFITNIVRYSQASHLNG